MAQFLQKKTRECGHAKLDVKWKKRLFLGAVANCGQRVGLVIFHVCLSLFLLELPALQVAAVETAQAQASALSSQRSCVVTVLQRQRTPKKMLA